MVKPIASTANVMKIMTLLRVLQRWERESYLPCHLAVFLNLREETLDSRLEAKSDSSSSSTADILSLQREGLTDMGFGHERVCPSPEKLDRGSTSKSKTIIGLIHKGSVLKTNRA